MTIKYMARGSVALNGNNAARPGQFTYISKTGDRRATPQTSSLLARSRRSCMRCQVFQVAAASACGSIHKRR